MFERALAHARANVIGYLALFVALSGSAYAAVHLPRNSVGTRQLRNGAVTGKKVARNTLTASNINLSTLGFQSRVNGTCAGSSAISAIAADGSVGCQQFGSGDGSVTSVGSGTGLTGGPITGAGTLSLDPAYRLPQSCTSGQVAKSSGAGAWSCAADQNSGGTVTTVGAGTGLIGGPITGSGKLSIASSYQLPQSCNAGQIPIQNNSGNWGCGSTNVTQVMGGSVGTVSGVIQFLAPVGLSSPSATYTDVTGNASALAASANNFSVQLSTAPGSGNSWDVGLIVNGFFQRVCTISGAGKSCGDTSSPVSIPAFATVAFEIVDAGGSPASTRVTFGWTETT